MINYKYQIRESDMRGLDAWIMNAPEHREECEDSEEDECICDAITDSIHNRDEWRSSVDEGREEEDA